MAQFKGFGFTSAEELQAGIQQQFAKAQASGNLDAARMATAAMAANAFVPNAHVRKARQSEEVLQGALAQATQDSTGDELEDEIQFLKNAQRAALDANLPEIALQATEKLSIAREGQEQRKRLLAQDARLKAAEERAVDRHEDEQEDREVVATERRLNQRRLLAATGVNAYEETIRSGGSREEATQNARKAQITFLAAQTEAGDLSAGAKRAREQGIDLSHETYNIEEEKALSADQSPQLKSMTTVMGEDGVPRLAFVTQTPSGPEITPTDFVDFDGLASLSSASSDKITDSQREAAAFAFEMQKDEQVLNSLHFVGEDFTGVGDTLEDTLPNRLKDDERQRYNTARDSFINALLRRKSGATIKDEEFIREEAVYFPAAGDNANVVAMKADLRRRALAGMMASAGQAAYANVVEQYLTVQSAAEAQELDQMGL